MATVSTSPTQKMLFFGAFALLAFAAALMMSYAKVLDATAAKYVVALLLAGVFCLAPFRLFSSGRLYVLVGSLFFPITLTVGGKDALSASSALIFLMTLLFALGLLVHAKPVKLDKIFWIAALIGIAAFGVLRSPREFWGPEIRHFINFASSALLFLMLVSWPTLGGEDRRKFAERLLVLVVVMACLQILIGLLVFHWPAVGKFFSVFLVRTKEVLAIEGDRIAMKRLSGLSMAIEEMGEFLAILCPLIVWLAVERNRWFWAVFFWIWVGLLYCNTRSGMLLGALSSLFMIVLCAKRMRLWDLMPLGLCLLGALMFGLLFYSTVIQSVVSHWEQVWHELRGDSEMMVVVNRKQAWPDAWRVMTSTLSLFGNGPAPSRVVGLNELNMHSLYMTLVYQFGVVGALLYLGLLLRILLGLLYAARKMAAESRLFPLACALALLVFLANEIKFEFNRGDYYQQLVWAMLAVFYLAAKPATDHTSDSAPS